MSSDKEYGLGGIKRRPSAFRWLYLGVMVILVLASFSYATQRVALYFAYHPGLGQHLFIAGGLAWFSPFKILDWTYLAKEHEAVRQAIFQAQMLFIVPQLVILGLAKLLGRSLKGRDDLHGSARWAREEDIRESGLLNGKGMYIGGWVKRIVGPAVLICWLLGSPAKRQHYLRHNGAEHVLVYAPTRSGKGIGIIIPTLLAWGDSTCVLDIKGENWALTSGYRKSLGHLVLRFDPSDTTGASARFNPLEEVRLNTLSAIPDVQNIAQMIVDPEGKGLQDHWAKAGFAFIAGALMHCMVMIRFTQSRTATLHDLGNMLADETKPIKLLFQEMLDTPHKEWMRECFPDGAVGAEQIHTFIASSAREMLNKAENEASGVVSTALVNLALYRDPVVAANTACSDFRVQDLLHDTNPVDLYLVVGVSDINRLRPLLRLILNLVIARICERMEFENGLQKKPPRRLLMLLDEFTSIGKMEIIEKSIAYAAGYGITFMLIIQDVEQLSSVYGKENGIRGNCHIRVAYAPNTLPTAKELSEMTGKTTVVDRKTSLSEGRGLFKSASVSVSETARPLLTPDECMRLPGLKKDAQNRAVEAGDMLIFVAGRPPIYGKQIMYFLDPVFSARAKIAAPAVSDTTVENPIPRELAPKPYQPPIPSHTQGYTEFLAARAAKGEPVQ
jgi:type IV secretion system protein VirD4